MNNWSPNKYWVRLRLKGSFTSAEDVGKYFKRNRLGKAFLHWDRESLDINRFNILENICVRNGSQAPIILVCSFERGAHGL